MASDASAYDDKVRIRFNNLRQCVQFDTTGNGSFGMLYDAFDRHKLLEGVFASCLMIVTRVYTDIINAEVIDLFGAFFHIFYIDHINHDFFIVLSGFSNSSLNRGIVRYAKNGNNVCSCFRGFHYFIAACIHNFQVS
ncbi:hypothetical protein D3C85_1293240 [compost metagenome]